MVTCSEQDDQTLHLLSKNSLRAFRWLSVCFDPRWAKPDAPLSKTWHQTRDRNLIKCFHTFPHLVCMPTSITSCFLTERYRADTVRSPQAVKTHGCVLHVDFVQMEKISVQEEVDPKTCGENLVISQVSQKRLMNGHFFHNRSCEKFVCKYSYNTLKRTLWNFTVFEIR